ncbi:MAG: hypothetical protein JW725_01405 [Candidatus Babeliaceae bacterium]|nr:hypothetical protein [Candidatus Babeliaceae bacterium]
MKNFKVGILTLLVLFLVLPNRSDAGLGDLVTPAALAAIIYGATKLVANSIDGFRKTAVEKLETDEDRQERLRAIEEINNQINVLEPTLSPYFKKLPETSGEADHILEELVGQYRKITDAGKYVEAVQKKVAEHEAKKPSNGWGIPQIFTQLLGIGGGASAGYLCAKQILKRFDSNKAVLANLEALKDLESKYAELKSKKDISPDALATCEREIEQIRQKLQNPTPVKNNNQALTWGAKIGAAMAGAAGGFCLTRWLNRFLFATPSKVDAEFSQKRDTWEKQYNHLKELVTKATELCEESKRKATCPIEAMGEFRKFAELIQKKEELVNPSYLNKVLEALFVPPQLVLQNGGK